MYTSQNFQIRDEETFSLCIPTDRDYKILQLTDLHLGFGMFSGKKDRLALAAVTELIRRTGPDLIGGRKHMKLLACFYQTCIQPCADCTERRDTTYDLCVISPIR